MAIGGSGAGGKGVCCSLPQISGRIDLLLIDNDSEKKKVSKNISHFKFAKNYW